MKLLLLLMLFVHRIFAMEQAPDPGNIHQRAAQGAPPSQLKMGCMLVGSTVAIVGGFKIFFDGMMATTEWSRAHNKPVDPKPLTPMMLLGLSSVFAGCAGCAKACCEDEWEKPWFSEWKKSDGTYKARNSECTNCGCLGSHVHKD